MMTGAFGINVLTLIVTLILARFLTPFDFGAIALVTGITGILQSFAEMVLLRPLFSGKILTRMWSTAHLLLLLVSRS